MKDVLTILACDPGSKNFAYTILQTRMQEGKVRFRIVETGMIDTLITQLKNSRVLRAESQAFLRAMLMLISKHKVDAIVGERYMSRRMGGVTIELVNMMIGYLCIAYSHKMLRFISAATWKNAVQRRGVDLEATYRITKVTPHQLDSCLNGLFSACIGYKQKDYGTIDLKAVMPKILSALEATSTAPLHERKALKALEKSQTKKRR